MPFLPNKKLKTVLKFSRTNLLNCFCILCLFNIKFIKIKSRISKVYAFFQKKSTHCFFITYSFANVLYLSICMLGNCSCFYFRLLTFFKKKFLKINHSVPPSECQTVWIQIKPDILVVLVWVQTVCKRLLAHDKIIHWHAKSYKR